MNITITRTGGLHGPAIRDMLGPVDVNDRGWEKLVEKIKQLVGEMNFFELPSQIPSQGGAQVLLFRTAITDGERHNDVLSDNASEEPYNSQLTTLIDLLQEGPAEFVPTPDGEKVDWDEVLVVPEFAGGFRVIVRGVAPVPTLVSFEPDPTEQDVDYRPIYIVGRRAAITLQVKTPWEITAPLDSLPSGRKGIVLVGATQRHYIPPQDLS
jgi:hypothetical protein